MIRHHDIPWFNPRQMDDATVRALSTGREDLLRDFFLAARQRLREPSAGKHWLVLGPRGAGKSFFLRLVQCRFAEAMNLEGKTASIVLLPEEQPNVFSPHEWLQEVQRLLPGHTRSKGQSPVWQVKDEAHAWQTALESLLDAFKGDLLVIAVENFDQLLAQAFDNDVRASRLRNLMENEPRIMLLASAVEGEFDEAYEKRLFRQFEHHPMPRWDERDHRDYLTRRAKLQDKEPTNRQLAKIDAYSRFTGGSARTAAVLAASILDEQDPLSASHDLMATLDRMSDYYRALIEKMPPNTRKIFDNLVRGGEPASQVELANRIQARQSDISKAFRWLTDYGYVINEKQPGSKEHSYRVSDRLFVQFYRMRYIDPDQPCQLAILADLLAATIEFSNKWQFAESYLGMEKHAEAELMARLACEERGVDVSLLPEEMRHAESLLDLGAEWQWLEMAGRRITNVGDFFRACFSRYKTDKALSEVFVKLQKLVAAVVREGFTGTEVLRNPAITKDAAALQMFFFSLVLDERFTQEDWLLMKSESNQPSLISGEVARLYSTHPLAGSLSRMSHYFLVSPDSKASVSCAEVAEWSARATTLWMAHKELGQAEFSFQICRRAVQRLLNDQFNPSAALKALKPLLKHADNLPGINPFRLHASVVLCLEALGRHDEAAEQLSAYDSDEDCEDIHDAWLAERLAWNLGMAAAGQPEDAAKRCMKIHSRALRRHRADQNDQGIAWNMGQIGRHMMNVDLDLDAWQDLHNCAARDKLDESSIVLMLQQIADIVWDNYKLEGGASGFYFGRKLLCELAARPQYPFVAVIRAMWIEMINIGVPLPLLRDLLHEVPLVFTDSTGSLASLCHTLVAWLDYLSATPEKRTEQLRRLDPDLAATLEGLSKNLSPKAQHRYGIVPNSVKS
jgi:hypothetical protein